MKNLDDLATVIANEGYLPRFQLLSPESLPLNPGSKLAIARSLFEKRFADHSGFSILNDLVYAYELLGQRLMSLQCSTSLKIARQAALHRHSLEQHITEVDRIIAQSELPS